MANLTKEQVREILMNAPEETSASGIIAGLRERGHTLEGYDTEEATKSKRTTLDKVSGFFDTVFGGGKIGEAIGTEIAKRTVPEEQKQFISPGPTGKQLAGDVLRIGATIGAAGLPVAGSILGKATQFGVLGATAGAGKELIEGGGIKEVAIGAGIGGALGVGTGATFGLAEKGIKSLGGLLGKAGEKIQTSVIKPTQADIKDGFSIGTVNKYNLGGSLKKTFEKTDSLLDNLSSELNKKITTSKVPVDLNEIYEKTAKRLLGDKFQSFGVNQSLDKALENLRNEIVAVSGKNGLVNLTEAQVVKRASGHFGAWLYGIPDAESTARQRVYNTFYNEIKQGIEKAAPEGVRGINKQISELIPVMNALIRRIPVAQRNSAISLTDIITATGAVFEPQALGLTLLNLASKSGKVGAGLAKFGPKVGETIGKGIQTIEPLVRFGINKK